ncbi:hypothetical protein BGW41_000091 [Actinomortierella wolfii]|nr:hypothetical protein BGW41_000091 [Actinomortierella wolfii]
MYRRRVKRQPKPVFGETLEEFGYSINNSECLVDSEGKNYVFDLKAPNRDYQEAHCHALTRAVRKKIEDRLAKEYGFIKATIPVGLDPNDAKSPQAYIMLSMQEFAVWSRRIMTNFNVEHGSVLGTVRRARAQGYGVIITNPNMQYWYNGMATYGVLLQVHCPPSGELSLIPGAESPERHVAYVLKHFVSRAKSNKVFFIAHQYGCHALLQSISEQFDTWKDRISACACIESSHTILGYEGEEFPAWVRQNVVGYVMSNPEERGKVTYMRAQGCNFYSTGTMEFDHTIVEAMEPAFKFFATRHDANNRSAEPRPMHPDDPTTLTLEGLGDDISVIVDENADNATW